MAERFPTAAKLIPKSPGKTAGKDKPERRADLGLSLANQKKLSGNADAA
jgi:hypothetical protein